MTFNTDIPQPLDWRPIDQGPIQQNMQTYYDVTAVEHVALDDATTADRGKHTVASLPKIPNANDPPATLDDEGAIYSRQKTDQPIQFMFREQSNGAEIVLAERSTPSYHGGLCLASATWTLSGGAAVIAKSFNIASIAFNSAALPARRPRFTLKFSFPPPSSNFILYPTAVGYGGGPINFSWSRIVNNEEFFLEYQPGPFDSATKFGVMVWGAIAS